MQVNMQLCCMFFWVKLFRAVEHDYIVRSNMPYIRLPQIKKNAYHIFFSEKEKNLYDI